MIKMLKINDTKLIFLGQIVAGILSLIATIFLARYTGPTVFGICASIILVFSVILDLIDFGACSWASRELASKSISLFQYYQIMKFKTRLALLPVFVLPISIRLIEVSPLTIALFLLYPFLWLRTNYIQQYLLASFKIGWSIRLQILERSFWLMVIPMSIFSIDKLIVYILPITLGLITHYLMGNRILKKEITLVNNFKETKISNLNFKSKHFGINSVLSDMNNLDGAIIAKISTFVESGNYNLAQRFRVPLMYAYQAIATKLRIIAASKIRNDIAGVLKDNFHFFVTATLGIAFLSILNIFYAESIFGDSYKGLNQVMCIGVLTAIPSGIGLIASSFLSAVNNEKTVAVVAIISASVSLSGVALMARSYGSLGAVIYLFFRHFSHRY
jgi:O-antigen/teichoic acid export membrane protein